MTDEKQQLLRYLINGHVELRCFDTISEAAKKRKRPVVYSGVFDDYTAMAKEIRYAHGMKMDIYSTINPTRLPATGKIKPYQATTKDRDITEIRTIFFDFDPKRETGTAATPDQVMLATNQAVLLSEFLDTEGWGIPTMGFSGNGAHLYYATKLPISAKDALPGLYAGLKRRFDTDHVKFDVVVRNPARIARVLGTENHKAHRKSSAIYCDHGVDENIVMATIAKVTPPKPKRTWVKPTDTEAKAGKYIKNWDIVGAHKAAGLYLKENAEPGKHFVTCPWAASHSFTGDSDTVIWEGEWAGWHCSHNSCSNRGVSDVIGVLHG